MTLVDDGDAQTKDAVTVVEVGFGESVGTA